ncbi:MAG: DUF4349 domain-containing protein [Lachnospiraceae bacterium]|nr:DUF4349 domain-containing protein [Lachnospiraceae bacterium]
MKKIIVYLLVMVMALSFAGCGNSNKGYTTADKNNEPAYDMGEYDEGGYSTGIDEYSAAEAKNADVMTDESYDEASDEYSEASDSNVDLDSTVTAKAAASTATINKDMLVYRGNVSIESTKFDESYEKIKNMIKDYDAFLESENLTSDYYKNYTANIRVASNKYEDFMESTGDVGTIKSKNSNAENVSQEYSDTAKALEIYEAKEARYIEQIKTIKDEQALIKLEETLTNLQVTIAQLKTRKSQIETDVAYSYVNISLREVAVIEEGDDSTFADRLKNTLSESGENFLGFLENLLFFLINALPILVVLFLIVFGIVKFIIFLVKRKKNKKEKKNKANDNDQNNNSEPNKDQK